MSAKGGRKAVTRDATRQEEFPIVMASEELKSSSPPETDEHPESCVTDPDPEGHYEPEDREIVGEVDSVECKGAVANPTHPLEHSWTFWFDNPSAKSKRVAWGASIRPMYTFCTVEEFWR